MISKLLSGGNPPNVTNKRRRAQAFSRLISKIYQGVDNGEFITLRLQITDATGEIQRMGKWSELPLHQERRQL